MVNTSGPLCRVAISCFVVLAIGCGHSNMSGDPQVDRDEQGRYRVGDLELTTQSESQARAALLGTRGTEDVRHLLGSLDLPKRRDSDEEREYRPDPTAEWVIDVRFPGDPSLDPDAVANAFDEAWRKQFGSISEYGRDKANGLWSYLIAADGPQAVDQLKLAFDYVPFNPDDPLPAEPLYAQRLAQVRQQLQRFGDPAVSASLTPAEAAARSRLLADLRRRLDMTATLVLKAPRGKRFEGRTVWDVMLCLGLEWGDMDCFHWRNLAELGDDSFFSVQTSTPPGYFLPEQVAAGRVQVEDLVFVFSVPRSARPLEVFDGMVKAIEYCRSRLEGTIADAEGKPVDVAKLRQQVEQIVEQLRAAGLEPGANATLRLF